MLRHVFHQWIFFKIGNGRRTRFWLDCWHPLGPLVEVFGSQAIVDSGAGLSDMVADYVGEFGWVWPDGHPILSYVLEMADTPRPILSREDSFLWLGEHDGRFSSNSAYEAVRIHSPKINWDEIVWFKGAFKKHVVYAWLIWLDRLPTKMRLCRWGLNVDVRCEFCAQGVDDRDHLFFSCSATRRIWRKLMKIVKGPHWISSWNDVCQWLLARLRWNDRRALTIKMTWEATLYHIWRERNRRYHPESNPCSEDAILNLILFDVKTRLVKSNAYCESSFCKYLCKAWGCDQVIC